MLFYNDEGCEKGHVIPTYRVDGTESSLSETPLACTPDDAGNWIGWE